MDSSAFVLAEEGLMCHVGCHIKHPDPRPIIIFVPIVIILFIDNLSAHLLFLGFLLLYFFLLLDYLFLLNYLLLFNDLLLLD